MKPGRLGVVVGAAVMVASVALGAEKAHHGGHAPAVTDLIFPTINFALFIWIIARFVMPGIRKAVHDRRDVIVDALQEAERVKAEAERLRREWEERLGKLEETTAELRAQAVAEAEKERTRILAAAEKTAETIRRDAERAAAYEVRRTQQLVRSELVQRALGLAEGQVRTKWAAADQQNSIDAFLKQVQA